MTNEPLVQVPFLDLKGITAKYRDEIHTALARVTDSGWYLLGEMVEQIGRAHV